MAFQAEQIRKIRKERGETLEDVAQALTKTRQAVQRWESGESQPPLHVLVALAKHFAVPESFFFTENITTDDNCKEVPCQK